MRKSWVGQAGSVLGTRLRCVLLLVLGLQAGNAAAAALLEMQSASAAEGATEVALRFDAPVQWRWFRLQDPERIVIDVQGLSLPALKPDLGGVVRAVRFGELEAGTRVVLDLQQSPDSVALESSDRQELRVAIRGRSAPAPEALPGLSPPTPEPTRLIAAVDRQVIVVIDPGHGGKDSGAVGPSGLMEKDVALNIARELRSQLQRRGGYQVVLTRDSDQFLALRERINVARKAGADLFVSIHADAFNDPRAHGSSVYVLSQRGASSEYARLLAQRENEADLVGGVALQERDETLAAVLLDISQSAAIEASVDIASRVLGGMGQLNKLHKSDVQRAGFVVLKSPDVPSILVETAFISNPGEERKLASPSHRRALASALANGIEHYFREYRPAELVTLEGGVGAAEHTVRAGETLSQIAERYGVSVRELRGANGLRNDVIRIGQRLSVPLRTAAR